MAASEAELLQPEQSPEKPGTLVEVSPKDLLIEPAAPNDSAMLQNLMTEAIRSGNRELMREVMEIRRELKAEAAREAFFAALSAFQSECPIIKRKKAVYDIDRVTRERKGTRYHYAPLDDIVRIAGPILTRHGLSYKTETSVEKRDSIDWLKAVCIVHHELGHVETSPPFEIPVMFSDFMTKQQSFASATTFAKRYAFLDALGILTGDDDNDATRVYTPQEAREAKARQPISQPRETPTAQKAAAQKANGKARPDIEPAGEGEAIDANTAKGLTVAMEHAKLTIEQFRERFPKLNGPEQLKKSDMRILTAWIQNPSEN